MEHRNIRSYILALCLVFSFKSNASEFEDGTSEFDTPASGKYTEADIQKKIEKEMMIACKANLCKIAGTDSHGSSWTVSFQIGYGQPGSSGGGSNIYIGGNTNNQFSEYANITVAYKNTVCSSSLKVTPSVYRFVNTYLYNMVNSDGSVKKNFSPADQTVILFYTTMLSKVDSCGRS